MSSTFLGLNIAKSGLSAAQVGLNITGNNISNADTDGYTRQRVSRAGTVASGNGYLINQITPSTNVGQGVTITSISQIRSDYLDEQYRDQYADFTSSEYLTQGLMYLEDLYDELDDDTSLTVSISDFYDALSELAADPTSEAVRTTVQQTAVSLTENFNMIYGEMVDLYNDQNTSVNTVASQINTLAAKIAELNEAIVEYEVSGETANNLRDERNLLLDELSGYVNITYSEDDGNMVSVQIAGETLVDGKTYNDITITTVKDEINTICNDLANLNAAISGTITPAQAAQRDEMIAALEAISGKITCTIDATGSTTVEIDYVDSSMTAVTDTLVSGGTFTATTSDAVIEYDGADEEYVLNLGDTYLNTETVAGGELYAHMLLRDSDSADDSGIPYYINQLDGLAQDIVESVNECMNTGYTYPDEENSYTSVTGVDVDMFEDFSGSYELVTAGNFSISSSVLESVWNIAASDTQIDLDAESTQSANNKVALLLADLINTEDYSDTLDGIISHLGLRVSSCESTLDTQEALVTSTESQRESISGVSIDEEAVNLITYQQTYNACSRTITTLDEMLDKLINGTGTVGL